MAELQEQLKLMEEEVVSLRRRLQDAPKRVRTLEERLLDTKGQLAQAVSQNEKLTYTLREAREHIAALRGYRSAWRMRARDGRELQARKSWTRKSNSSAVWNWMRQ